MRLSIWHQFSSNHSASFTVIGVFETAAAASRAASELEAIMAEIERWFKTPENSKAVFEEMDRNKGDFAPTPPEIAIGARYGIEWLRGIDWHFGLWSRTAGVRTAEQYENIVFVQNVSATWQGPQPFDALMAKLGGTVYVDAEQCDSYPDTMVVVTLTCTAPDEAKAGWLDRVLQDHLETGNLERVPDYLFDDGMSLADHEPRLQFNQFSHEGRQIRLTNVILAGLEECLPRLVAFLRSEGCSDIAYTFVEVRFTNEAET